MLKNISKLECIIENKTYNFLCDTDASLTHVKEALFQFLKYVGQVEDQVKAAQAQIKTDSVTAEKLEEIA